ncbi:hypothetical protein ABFV62_31155, partial [Pseudomonas syringae]|uniref:hypothetical protein n=1 Tax=Pseudomonas syringae TaxID=317 RepID=UPI0034D75325
GPKQNQTQQQTNHPPAQYNQQNKTPKGHPPHQPQKIKNPHKTTKKNNKFWKIKMTRPNTKTINTTHTILIAKNLAVINFKR